MIIDAHNHLGFRYDRGQSDTEILKRMDAAGVDMAVCFPQPKIWDNQYVYEKAQLHSDRIIQFVGVDPWKADAADEVRKYLDLGARGMKLHPVRDSYSLTSPDLVNPLFEICEEFGVPILVHGKDEWSNTPWHFSEMAQRFPNINLIMAHGGHNWLREDALVVARKHKNIYLESSLMYSDYVRRMVYEVAEDRMIMGTDGPYEAFETELKKIDMAVEDPEKRLLVKGLNLARLLRIQGP